MVGIMNKYTHAIIGLYKSDYATEYHIRQIAGLLNVSHVTLLPHLNELIRANVLTERISGKNKQLSLNLENILTKDYLTLTEISAATAFLAKSFFLKKLYSEIFALTPAGVVALFGSYAMNTQGKESDIDLLYIGDKKEQFISEMRKFGSLYGKEVNTKKTTLANFEKALRERNALVREVLNNHILLHQPSIFVDCVWRYYREIR